MWTHLSLVSGQGCNSIRQARTVFESLPPSSLRLSVWCLHQGAEGRVGPTWPVILFDEVMGTGQGLPGLGTGSPRSGDGARQVMAGYSALTERTRRPTLQEDGWVLGRFSLLPTGACSPQDCPFISSLLRVQHLLPAGHCGAGRWARGTAIQEDKTRTA